MCKEEKDRIALRNEKVSPPPHTGVLVPPSVFGGAFSLVRSPRNGPFLAKERFTRAPTGKPVLGSVYRSVRRRQNCLNIRAPTHGSAATRETRSSPNDFTVSVAAPPQLQLRLQRQRSRRTLRQREATTEGSKRREREELSQARVRPRRFHLAGGCPL